ncbi:hypothetical protein TRFO_37838 [Tritrichomonas foetus]|uniref:Uncharacterized protein n=1 Tax=Tritrichomonas foetus TaxID=1144522 RepID=A0A1J4J9Y2_9EUKA|nr:hypothetical protein TRFO_37838 [Tritrichomonas foetus]|eukprot:OHS95998.1 hypothetical protein TRFO_37838 [Tritrichomonas foetus]
MRVAANFVVPQLKCNVSSEEFSSKIISSVAVRRPLAIPAASKVYGNVLCHSGCVVKTTTGYYVVKYMFDNFVHVNRCNKYIPGKNFTFQGFLWIHDDPNSSYTKKKVTLRQFANGMVQLMKGHNFNTFTHNCLQARYLTMKKFGMTSVDPLNDKRCIFLQGWFDFYSKKYWIERKIKEI